MRVASGGRNDFVVLRYGEVSTLLYSLVPRPFQALGEGRKGPGTHRLRMRRLYHVVAIIFPKKFTRVLRIFCRPHGDGPHCAVESARKKPSTTTLPKAG